MYIYVYIYIYTNYNFDRLVTGKYIPNIFLNGRLQDHEETIVFLSHM